MKFLRTLAAVPLFTMGLWAADSAGTGITTPESLFPQLDAILKHTVSQSPAMVTRATEMESAENDRAVARANLLPTAGGYLTYVESSDNRSDQPETVRVRKTGKRMPASAATFETSTCTPSATACARV